MQLVSVSKDALGKVWDLSTQHCVQTLTGHRSEVWSVSVSADGTRILTGAADRQLRVWAVGSQAEDGEGVATYMGSVLREGNDRCLSIKYVGHAMPRLPSLFSVEDQADEAPHSGCNVGAIYRS